TSDYNISTALYDVVTPVLLSPSHRNALSMLFLFLMIPRPPLSTLFPYTTLFRSFSIRFVNTSFGTIPSADKTARNGEEFRFKNRDRKSTRLNSSHVSISYAVFCLKKKIQEESSQWRKKQRTEAKYDIRHDQEIA